MASSQISLADAEQDDLELLLSGVLQVDQLGMTSFRAAVESGDGDLCEFVDSEGAPLAELTSDGALRQRAPRVARPFEELYLSPGEVRCSSQGAVLVPLEAPLTESAVADIAGRAAGKPVVLVALVGDGWPVGADAVGLIRGMRSAVRALESLCDGAEPRPANIACVAVPLARTGNEAQDAMRRKAVLRAYGGDDHLMELGPAPRLSSHRHSAAPPGPPDSPGLVVLFTGLSGSGKSTVARGVRNALIEHGARAVTLLDGDVVRRHLSKGLGFSRQDRDTNMRRIGWVAAEVARHGGIAVASPIAPFKASRAEVRRMAERAGAVFVLVHISTPLEVCERRDRKGLYARARAGEVAEFTGISSPYEVPEDADIQLDTTDLGVQDAIDAVVRLLRRRGF